MTRHAAGAIGLTHAPELARIELTVSPSDAEVQLNLGEWTPASVLTLVRLAPGSFAIPEDFPLLAGWPAEDIAGTVAAIGNAVAHALAAHWPLEVISADSRQVYKLLDIGTAKVTAADRARVVIVGGGQAGLAFGSDLRQLDLAGITGHPQTPSQSRIRASGSGLSVMSPAARSLLRV